MASLYSLNARHAQKINGLPAAPQRIEDTGLDFHFLVELLAKTLYLRGQLRIPELVSTTKLSHGVLDPLLTFMRAERLCEMVRKGETEGSMAYSLTDHGRARAHDFLARNQYCGPAPVALADYVEQVQAQSVSGMSVDRAAMRAAFSDLVVTDALLDEFGAAMNVGRAIFVHGPAGSGKSLMSAQLVKVLSGDVGVPYAIAVDNEVIQVFDELVHEPIEQEATANGIATPLRHDPRWVLCRRPVATTGAELTLAMVDLQFDPKSRFYQAPPQVKANNGLFIVDDLGRQLVSPQDLMNRWIVPLERRVDYLSLHTGKKFVVPFDVIVLFSSNLTPGALGDEAFLRRLGNKIHVGPLAEQEYRALVTKTCSDLGIGFDDSGYAHLLATHERQGVQLLACIPRDILWQVRAQARFQAVDVRFSPGAIDGAWRAYFGALTTAHS